MVQVVFDICKVSEVVGNFVPAVHAGVGADVLVTIVVDLMVAEGTAFLDIKVAAAKDGVNSCTVKGQAAVSGVTVNVVLAVHIGVGAGITKSCTAQYCECGSVI